MRWVLATVASLLVLGATWPVLCVQGEFDSGSCKSAFLVPTLGSAASADSWVLAVSLPAALLAFGSVLMITRRR